MPDNLATTDDFYDRLPVESRDLLKANASEVKVLAKRSVDDVIAMGKRLAEAAIAVDRGTFQQWIALEFMDAWDSDSPSGALRVAEHLMNIAKVFGGGEDIKALEKIGYRNLRELAAPSTPKEVRIQILEKAKKGEKVRFGDVQAAKVAVKKQPEKFSPQPTPAREIQKTPVATEAKSEPKERRSAEPMGWRPTPVVDRDDCDYTPEFIYRLGLAAIGSKEFDLDPASNSHENPNIPAKKHLTFRENGLLHDWWPATSVWLNPPASWSSQFIGKALLHYQRGEIDNVFIVMRADFSTGKERKEILGRYPICFITNRFRFDNQIKGSEFPHVVAYLGVNTKDFYLNFDIRYNRENGIGIVMQAGLRGVHFDPTYDPFEDFEVQNEADQGA